MKRLLPSSFEFVNTQYGSAPKRSCIGYHLRTTTLSSGSNRTPQQLDSGKIGHVFPSLPMPTTQKSSADSLKWPIHILDAQALERRTIGQASSEEWQKTHGHTLTASNFRRICCCLNGHENLLKALFDSTDLSRVPAVQHGKKHEAVAVEKYIAIMKERGKSVSVRNCGIVLDIDYRYIGASPDGMVLDPSSRPRYGLLEVKCPYSAYCKSLTVEQAVAHEKGFCLISSDTHIQLSRSHAYYWQVQGQLAVSRLKWCDFFVWLGDSFFLERIQADQTMWLHQTLPGLQAFYYKHAVPYLTALDRPAANTAPQASSSTAIPYRDYESVLRMDLCQSRIDGRNGSNACTFIAVSFMQNMLKTSGDVSVAAMCQAMRDGNAAYDALGKNTLFSVDEVLDSMPTELSLCMESFVRPTTAAITAMVEVMASQAETTSCEVFGGVFVLNPFSFCMCFHHKYFILFDSHSHGDGGALLSVVPGDQAVGYLEYFFSCHYAHLQFNSSSANLAAHMSFLSLS